MNEETDFESELSDLHDRIAAAESGERAGLFTEYFTLARMESLAEQWADNEFRLEAVLSRIGAVRGFGRRVAQLIASIKRAQRRAQPPVVARDGRLGPRCRPGRSAAAAAGAVSAGGTANARSGPSSCTALRSATAWGLGAILEDRDSSA